VNADGTVAFKWFAASNASTATLAEVEAPNITYRHLGERPGWDLVA